MPELHLFEYAIVRIVPRVEREEFLNVGVVLYCRDHRFLQTICTLQEHRLGCFSPEADLQELKSNLEAFEQICRGGREAGPIGLLDMASRFRWLTANRSTVVQTSRVHPGLCADPLATLVRLHERLVL